MSNRIHHWLSSQHSFIARADSPLLGFPDESSDPLFCPSPDFVRDLPSEVTAHDDEGLPWDFLTEIHDDDGRDDWGNDPPSPPPPPPSPAASHQTLPPSPIVIDVDEHALLGSTRPRSLSRASGIAYTPPQTPVCGRPRSKSTAHAHSRQPSASVSRSSHDRLPSISSTLSKISQRSSRPTFFPSPPTRNSSIYLGEDPSASQSKWSLDELDAQEKKKPGKRQRLVSFIAHIGVKTPPPAPPSEEEEEEEEADGLGALRLDLDRIVRPFDGARLVEDEGSSSEEDAELTQRPFVSLFTRAFPSAQSSFPSSPSSSSFTASASTSASASPPYSRFSPYDPQPSLPLRHMLSDSQLHHPEPMPTSRSAKHLSTPGTGMSYPTWTGSSSSSSAKSVKSAKSRKGRLVAFISRFAPSSADSDTLDESTPSSPPTDVVPPSFDSHTQDTGRKKRMSKIPLLGLGMGERKRRPVLIVEGVDREDNAGCDAVRYWCENFGQVKTFVRRPSGSLEVDWARASVAETVCKLQKQVYIKGAGSVTLSSRG